ncbi:SMI1/KNR4 family protein [Haloplasma contractile]|uniref:Cell wall assembly-cell proliferation coordinating protein KNR4-like protein n=1 Tax=Haloplasma contractile SSD-17B TaxID=1033810 RepID=U2FDM2_9MOLU|nr:SMI1/KNR4 family protein [Haloplasma contractile]ERJ11075.1 cell wall assembly-cell proliferation coordinating protein KNR4-like protein [Haloplasma contractile SSD-17B]
MIDIKPNSLENISQQVDRLEQRLNLKLPLDYKEFLIKTNGGIPEDNVFIHADQSFSIDTFFGFVSNEIDNLNNQFKNFQTISTNHYLPICRLEGGDLLVINFNEHDYGNIMLCEHETDQMIKISETFDTFTKLVTPYNPTSGELSGYEVLDVKIDPDFLKELEEYK